MGIIRISILPVLYIKLKKFITSQTDKSSQAIIIMKRKKVYWFFQMVLSIIICSVTACANDPDIQLNPDSVTEAVYLVDGQDSLKLWIHTPEMWSVESGLPVILFFHGGGGDTEQFVPQAGHFCGRGMVAIRVLHRLQTGYGMDNKGFLDGISAVRWVREHAGALGIDPNRIVLSGGSAGGGVSLGCFHYEGWYAHASDDTSVDCEPNLLILFNPAVSMFLEEPFNREHHPASIFFQGSADVVTPLDTLRKYISISEAKTTNQLDLVIYRGRNHGFFNYNSINNEDYENTLARADTFLVDYGYIPALTCVPGVTKGTDASVPVLYPNFPNPFNNISTIRYFVPEKAYVRISIKNCIGKEVRCVVNKTMADGKYSESIPFNGLPSGVYIVTLFINNRITESRKMILLQ